MGNYGISNIQPAIGPATNIIEAAVRVFQGKFSGAKLLNEVVNIALSFSVYRTVIQNAAAILQEAKDLDPAESKALAVTFQREFDIADDIAEGKVERMILSAAELHERINTLLPVLRQALGSGSMTISERLRLIGDAFKEVAYLAAWAIGAFVEYRELIEAKQRAEKKSLSAG